MEFSPGNPRRCWMLKPEGMLQHGRAREAKEEKGLLSSPRRNRGCTDIVVFLVFVFFVCGMVSTNIRQCFDGEYIMQFGTNGGGCITGNGRNGGGCIRGKGRMVVDV
ncbi:hypothetical protein PoB_003723600 [Plakobranchus ocellatus]|uniref:Transmembrane protein n=1 Tax=Plakobranchus ocellatus TaxID=259542 RepID=A0AAV4ARD8_9GAST|nr:hypothetical protein PoB_003723600 [Plakobranchus ocellatus]